jgi:hypothetical protein
MQVLFGQEKKDGYPETVVGEPGAQPTYAWPISRSVVNGRGSSPAGGRHARRPADAGFTHVCAACDDVEERLVAAGGVAFTSRSRLTPARTPGDGAVSGRSGRSRRRALRTVGRVTPFDPLDTASTPFGAPLVPALPIRLRAEISPLSAAPYVKPRNRFCRSPCGLASDLCLRHLYHVRDAEWFGVYCESGWQIPVLPPDDYGAVFSPFLVLESDGAVAAGREGYLRPARKGRARPARASR